MKYINNFLLVVFVSGLLPNFSIAGIDNISHDVFCSFASNSSEKRNSAKKYLDLLRSGDSQYNLWIENIKKFSREGNFSLSEIGTSRAELRELKVLGCKVSAEIWLKQLRRADLTDYDSALCSLNEKLSEGHLTLEDLGTSEYEISKIKKSVHLREGVKILQRLRNQPNRYAEFIVLLRMHLRRGELTLNQIGTSESEIALIRKVAYGR